jgi:hypothetical protein
LAEDCHCDAPDFSYFRSKSLKYHQLFAVMRLAAAISPDVLY